MDPISMEILSNKVAAIAEQMGYILQRTARTLFVKEASDFSTALVDREGMFFAYPHSTGTKSFMGLNCMPAILEAGELEEGDVIVTNDPYVSEGMSTHLPDIHMLAPYFHEGKLICYGWCFIHSTDVGGNVPSSVAPSNREIFQEGLQIPPMKILKKGEFNQDFLKLYKANCRTPDDNMGDINAMIAALRGGGRLVADLIAQSGVEAVIDIQSEVQEYSARKARAAFRRIPDGDYEFHDYMDDDVTSPFPFRVKTIMSVRDGLIELDFRESDPQVPSAYNLPTAGKRHPWTANKLVSFVCTQDKLAPRNAGLYRPISVKIRKGTCLDPERPAAVGVRYATAMRVVDAVNGAIARAAPDLVSACGGGVAVPVVLVENRPGTFKPHVQVIQPVVGGMGARRGLDGTDARDAAGANISNNPVETVEGESNLLIHEYRTRIDAGGPGKWRGGVGQILRFEVLQDGGNVLARGIERLRFAPWGILGGKPGMNFNVFFTPHKGETQSIGKIDLLHVNKGDVVTIMTPGGGGYGNPFERDPGAVLLDVQRGFVSAERAQIDYGVVIAKDKVDEDATRAMRARMKTNSPDFSFCAEREAWDRVFDNATLLSLNEKLYTLPLNSRHAWRQRILASAVGGTERLRKGRLVDLLTDVDAARERVRSALEELVV